MTEGDKSMERVIFDEVVWTDYGQFDLIWDDDYGFDGDFDRFFQGQVNGLAGAATGGGLYTHFGRRSGGSQVRITLLDAPPADLDPQWEDVVEVSVTVPAEPTPIYSTWAGEESGPVALPPGTYRVRVNARGRDAGSGDGEDAEGVVDHYLIEFWAAPSQPDAILSTGSEDAAYWHREVGNRR